MDKVNLKEKFSQFADQWSPKVVGELNDNYIKLAKLEGEFVWHHHANEDEMFLVIKGELLIKLKDKDIHLSPGEFFVVPKGVEHLPIATQECHVMLIEPQNRFEYRQRLRRKNHRNVRPYLDKRSGTKEIPAFAGMT